VRPGYRRNSEGLRVVDDDDGCNRPQKRQQRACSDFVPGQSDGASSAKPFYSLGAGSDFAGCLAAASVLLAGAFGGGISF